MKIYGIFGPSEIHLWAAGDEGYASWRLRVWNPLMVESIYTNCVLPAYWIYVPL